MKGVRKFGLRMKGDALLAAILAASALFASVNGQDDSKYEMMDRDPK